MRFARGLEPGGRSRCHARPIAFAVALAAVSVLSLTALAGTARADGSCDVRNGTNSYGTLQAAVTDAQAGDTIEVRGTCFGATIVNRDLTLTGVDSPHGTPTLDGRRDFVKGTGDLPVTVAAGAHVLIKQLLITKGWGPGVRVFGSLTLKESSVVDNFQIDVGGIRIERGGSAAISRTTLRSNFGGDAGAILNLGTLRLDRSAVEDNRGFAGAGIENFGDALVTRSAIRGNSADWAGGILNAQTGTLVVRDSDISHNSGSGVWNRNKAAIYQSSVSGNADDFIGAIYNEPFVGETTSKPDLLVVGSKIEGNVGGQWVGGIYNPEGAEALVRETLIAGNRAMLAGGVRNAGTFQLDHTTVTENEMTGSGGAGGFFNEPPGTLVAIASPIFANIPTNCVGC